MFRQLRSRFPYIRGRHLYDAYAACLLIELASRTLARGVRQWEIYMGKEDSRDRAEAS